MSSPVKDTKGVTDTNSVPTETHTVPADNYSADSVPETEMKVETQSLQSTDNSLCSEITASSEKVLIPIIEELSDRIKNEMLSIDNGDSDEKLSKEALKVYFVEKRSPSDSSTPNISDMFVEQSITNDETKSHDDSPAGTKDLDQEVEIAVTNIISNFKTDSFSQDNICNEVPQAADANTNNATEQSSRSNHISPIRIRVELVEPVTSDESKTSHSLDVEGSSKITEQPSKVANIVTKSNVSIDITPTDTPAEMADVACGQTKDNENPVIDNHSGKDLQQASKVILKKHNEPIDASCSVSVVKSVVPEEISESTERGTAPAAVNTSQVQAKENVSLNQVQKPIHKSSETQVRALLKSSSEAETSGSCTTTNPTNKDGHKGSGSVQNPQSEAVCQEAAHTCTNEASAESDNLSGNVENVIQHQSMASTFEGSKILITGATGFLGKVLLEKLLRTCHGIDKVYVLIRSKKGKAAKERIEELMKDKVFENLQQDASVLSKVTAVPGHLTKETLTDCPDDHEKLMDVTFVFHCAATVRFNETARDSLATNLQGTANLLNLCQKMKKLEGFVHVSTAYSFCNRKRIAEKVYEETLEPSLLINLLPWMSDALLKQLDPNALKERPSIYHYSKAMAEHCVLKHKGTVPTAIVRPSIITGSFKEPFPGWTDTSFGPNGLIAACAMGVIRSVYAYPHVTANFIPVDIVANTLIAAARYISINRPSEVFIVNCVSDPSNEITWGQVEEMCYPLLLKYAFSHSFRYPGGSFKRSYILHRLAIILDHYFPACIANMTSWITRRNINMFQVYKRLHRRMSHLEYFTTHDFTFENGNMMALTNATEDSEVFPMDVKSLDWSSYLDYYVHGIRKYLLKDGDETLENAKKQLNRKYYTWLAIRSVPVIVGAMLYIYRHTLMDLYNWISGILATHCADELTY